MLDETNLFKFFLSGISILAVVTCDSKIKPLIGAALCQKSIDIATDKTFCFLTAAFRSLFFKVKMSTDNTFDLLMEFLNTINPDIPDGADLIDSIGGLAQEIGFCDTIKQVPVIEALLNWAKDECLCDIQIAALIDGGAVHLRIKTEGIKELYEKVLQGFN